MPPRITPEMFWGKVVDGPGGCWLWTGNTDGHGYGRAGRGGRMIAHRIAYEYIKGSIPNGLQIDHLCRVRHCVNPEHLEPVTQRENIRRGMSPSAIVNRTGLCLRGHPMSGANVKKRINGKLRCLACQKIWNNRTHHRLDGDKNRGSR